MSLNLIYLVLLINYKKVNNSGIFFKPDTEYLPKQRNRLFTDLTLTRQAIYLESSVTCNIYLLIARKTKQPCNFLFSFTIYKVPNFWNKSKQPLTVESRNSLRAFPSSSILTIFFSVPQDTRGSQTAWQQEYLYDLNTVL